jgi:hypothetical protein
MKAQTFSGLVLFVLLLLLAVGSVLAEGPQSSIPKVLGTNSSNLAAKAPWFNSEIDTNGDTGLHVSVAYDPTWGKIYISYYDATDQQLRLARSDGKGLACGPKGEWGCSTIDSGADVGKYNSIAINPVSGGIGIAYHDATNGKLKYIYFENPQSLNYSTYTIDKGIEGVSTTGLYTSLVYSDEGKPFIAYYFDNPTPGGVDALMVAYDSITNGDCGYGSIENTWRCHTIISGEGVGQYPSLEIINGWDTYVAYYDRGSGDLWYAKDFDEEANCGYWGTDMACYPVDMTNGDVGKYASMYVDDATNFHIAYYDATNEELKYAYELDSSTGNCGVGGSAQCDTIDDMPADYHPLGISIAEDGANYPIIAYQSANGSLNVARPVAALGWPAGSGNCGPEDPFASWHCQTIDRSGTWIIYRNADYASITLNSSGLATIAYYGFIKDDSGNLMVSQQLFQHFMPLVLKNQ